jgi:hypothetical protein
MDESEREPQTFFKIVEPYPRINRTDHNSSAPRDIFGKHAEEADDDEEEQQPEVMVVGNDLVKTERDDKLNEWQTIELVEKLKESMRLINITSPSSVIKRCEYRERQVNG